METNTTYAPLAKSYKKNGYHFKQVARNGDVAIYEQLFEGNIIAYEVFEVRKDKEREIFGKIFSAHETCPSNEDWGDNAFTVHTLEQAEQKKAYILGRIEARNLLNVAV